MQVSSPEPRRPAATTLFAACGALLLAPRGARAQIRIIAPLSLSEQFVDSQGVVYGTTATFGAPYWGERVMGRLLYGKPNGKEHCDAKDYQLTSPSDDPVRLGDADTAKRDRKLLNVVLVRRGKCTFAKKVKVAEAKGAHAVIVVDKRSSTKTSEEIQRVVMSDDGTGDSVRIPSVMISRFDGQKLIDAVEAEEVVVELAWDIPRGEVVVADFWMSSGSRESNKFLERFKNSAERLGYNLQFVPHYHVFSIPHDTEQSHLCADAAGKHCAPDPDGPGPVTGADVANEDLRQLCIWNLTARTANGRPKGAMYSQEFWDYVVRFQRKCPLTGHSEVRRFGDSCASRVMDQLGLPKGEVTDCMGKNRETFLDEQVKNIAWSPQALRLNGWRYSGPLDPETVLKAVCSGYATPPSSCGDFLTESKAQWPASTLAFGVLLWVMILFGCFLTLLLYFYRRHVTGSVRKVLREEVMLEVQTQMEDYTLMPDGTEASKSRPLAF